MNYKKIYNNIIESAKKQSRAKGEGLYYEKHHIVPKCLGGTNNEENLVLLTGREHYVCHKLLYKAYPGVNPLFKAWHIMAFMKNEFQDRYITLTSKEYQILREKHSKILSGRFISEETRAKLSKANTGKTLPQEVRAKISKAGKGRKQTPEHIAAVKKALAENPPPKRVGYKHSEDTKTKMIETWKRKKEEGYKCPCAGWNIGIPLPEDQKKRISEKLKGVKLDDRHGEEKANEIRNKLSESGKSIPHTEEWNAKVAAARREWFKNNPSTEEDTIRRQKLYSEKLGKRVVCRDASGVVTAEYKSLKETERQTGILRQIIQRVIRQGVEYKGLHWSFETKD